MGDVGIDLLKPHYEKDMIVAADTAYWEVLYDDGSTLCEASGAKYASIARDRLESFRIIHNGTIVFEIFPKAGKTGHNLIYRRRTSFAQSNAAPRSVVYIVGLAPDGPFYMVDLANGEYFEDTAGILPTLAPMPGEPADLLKEL